MMGRELQRIREDVGFTRRNVAANLDGGMHHQTIYHYEYGTRDLSVIRLVQLAMLLGVYAPDVLAAVLQQSRVDLSIVTVDPVAVLLDEGSPVVLRHWAQPLAQQPGPVRLTMAAVFELAAELDLDAPDLLDCLVRYTPRPMSRHIAQ